MACFQPLNAYLNYGEKTENGRSVIVFKLQETSPLFENVKLPCGKCIGCQIQKSKDWATRCYHEASLYDDNMFITLTYNEQNIDKNKSLDKKAFPKFMKRFRKKYSGTKGIKNEKGKLEFPIRYFHCGEYGSDFDRPHHHACIFNFAFNDMELLKVKNDVKLYRSESLERLWSKEIKPSDYHCYDSNTVFESAGKYYVKLGYCTIGDVTFESAAYIARYCTKKFYGADKKNYINSLDTETGECVYLTPEFVSMSRRPGIGKKFFDKRHKSDIYNKDFCTINGSKLKPPKYYDRLYDQIDPLDFERIRKKRRIQIKNTDTSPRRLLAREKVAEARLKTKERTYEKNG